MNTHFVFVDNSWISAKAGIRHHVIVVLVVGLRAIFV